MNLEKTTPNLLFGASAHRRCKYVTVRFTREELEELAHLANQQNRSISLLIRSILRDFAPLCSVKERE